MDPNDFWHMFNICRAKATRLSLPFLIAFLALPALHAQNAEMGFNLPMHDQRRIHYGFLLGMNNAGYNVLFNETFTGPGLATLQSVMAPRTTGFSVGMLANVKVAQYLDVRVLPTVSFYEYQLEYNYTDGTTSNVLQENTFVELPILFKYKSQRRKNHRMYIVGGFNPSIEASGKGQNDISDELLLTRRWNYAAEFGFGMDVYFELFMFSPELRYSRGLNNILRDESNELSQGLARISTNKVSLLLIFQ